MKNMPEISEKIDIHTNNPRKLFRAISDLFEDHMKKRGYHILDENEPTLRETGVHGVAEFDGNIDMIKSSKSRSKQRAITGIFVILMGVAMFIFRNSLSSLVSSNSESYFANPMSEPFQYGGIIIVIIGLIIISSKTKVGLIIRVDLEGESYQYKGNKQTEIAEEKQRLDVVSDVRITISGLFSKENYYNQKFKMQLKYDVQFIKEKLDGIIPEYRLPS